MGDVVLDDARQLRALADQNRLAIFDWLQKHGPRAATDVATRLGLANDDVLDALGVLAAAGLVEELDGHWRAHGRGLFLQVGPDDPAAQSAARALGVVMLAAAAELPSRWLAETEPRLYAAWAAAAGLFNAGIALTPDEVEQVQEELERILAPYLNRQQAERPSNARKVRVLAYFLPGAAAPAGDDG